MVAAAAVIAGLPAVLQLAERKVRASQGTMPDNVRAGRPDGKCHRNDTAARTGWQQEVLDTIFACFILHTSFAASCSLPVRAATVKWCIKSAPATWRHAGLVNPIGSKV